jgi:hypothetical protein
MTTRQELDALLDRLSDRDSIVSLVEPGLVGSVVALLPTWVVRYPR